MDIGGDTSDVAIFQEGTISHATTIPMGARSITSDLGLLLRVSPEVAESIKLRQGSALPLEIDPDEVIQITSIGEEGPRPVTRRHVAQIIEARTTELLDHVARAIEAAGATNRLQTGLVLTGGGALLQGLARAARDQLGMATRVVPPTGLGGLVDKVGTPAFATASGLLLWGARSGAGEGERRTSHNTLDGIGGRLRRLFGGLNP